MKYSFFLLFLVFGVSPLSAQKYIDFQQYRLDMLDGIEDYKLAGHDNTDVFFKQVDELQKKLDTDLLQAETKEKIQLGICYQLINYTQNSSLNLDEWQSYFILEDYLHALMDSGSDYYFKSNPISTYSILPFIYNTAEARLFLESEAILNPDVVLKHFKSFANASYAENILSLTLQSNPIAAKQYLTTLHPIYLKLKESSNPMNQLVLSIFNQTGRASQALSLLDAIYHKELSIDKANEIAFVGGEDFFELLTALSVKPKVLAKQSIDELLKSICTQKVRYVNSQFENHNDSQRFRSVEQYSTEQLYHLIVYSEEEIFTSSFNGIFNLLIKKTSASKEGNYVLLENVNFNKFRTFLKMCIAYGKLDTFLNGMSSEERELLIQRFIYLDDEKDLLREAVSVADALGSIRDSTSLFQLEVNLLKNIRQTESYELELIYSLLMKLFESKATNFGEEFKTYTDYVQLQSNQGISHLDLYGEDARHTQIHCFYNDKDGVLSFQTFLNLWQNNNWEIVDYGEFVQIKSTSGMPFQIFANRPEHDTDGQKLIHQFIDAMYADIDVLVHRGHSFYVSKSLLNLRKETRIVLLGSCGGYHQVTDILNRSPHAHIISTKQIGSYTVNNPLIYLLAQEIDDANAIEWKTFWKDLSDKFNTESNAYEKFLEYVPPHQNLGAAFIQAYRNHLTVK